LRERFLQTRRFSEQLCEPLSVEDMVVQAMPDASPTKWHLAHTSWFFETFVLARWEADYRPLNDDYQVLFNSYYNTVGEQYPRPRRGLLTRPSVADVFAYRHDVDERVERLLDKLAGEAALEAAQIVETGIHHEQQHQELILTDIKYLFSCNPLWPVYRAVANAVALDHSAGGWSQYDGDVVDVGYSGQEFCFDNERPRHQVLLQPFELNERLVSNGDYLKFIDDHGYQRPELWLSLGWNTVRDQKWQAPLYWVQQDDAWQEFTLGGLRPLNLAEPVCHVSYFEADAFARWSGARLPTEFEWEHAAEPVEVTGGFADSVTGGFADSVTGGFADSGRYHPRAPGGNVKALAQLYGEAWQWTASPYTPYPGFAAPAGALGEYNGKFMCNQYVLRGGSCATPAGHVRATYRNFFPPEARWQFSGIRLARDAQR
jgi:ergothioneine biosynthesis protein EgtB